MYHWAFTKSTVWRSPPVQRFTLRSGNRGTEPLDPKPYNLLPSAKRIIDF
ncbi:hypothetical protein PN466_17215 [Roseofilum reptotaenium CS-1145]|nr:hypothetical protein [Roseofilum reptotaenium CS-1145]